MKFSSISMPGPKGRNQDAILEPFQVGESVWCGISDGVGSSDAGELAARTSLEIVKQYAERLSIPQIFEQVYINLSRIAKEQIPGKTLSTTLSILRLNGNQAKIGHVGDTRISHYRGNGVVARTKDQTEVQKLIDDNVITKNQAKRYPRRNVLLSAMSPGRKYDLFENDFTVQDGDRILLTSDGFHSKLLKREIADISASNSDFNRFWAEMNTAISEEKLDDDATCLAIEIEI